MATIPVRFQRGQGLQQSASDKTQPGLLALQNTDLEYRDVIRRRPGHVESDLVDKDGAALSDPVACWFLGDELAVEGQNDLYVRRECEFGAPTWDVRGPWTRTRLRVTVAHDSGQEPMRQAGAAVVTGGNQTCTVVISETLGDIDRLRADVIADTGERWQLGRELLDETDALIWRQLDASAGISSVAGAVLNWRTWSAGGDFDAIVPAAIATLSAAHIYDADGAAALGGSYAAFILRDGAGVQRIRIRWLLGGGTVDVDDVLATGIVVTVAAVAIHATDDPAYAGARVAYAIAGQDAGGNAVVRVVVRSYRSSTGTQDGADTVAEDVAVSTVTPNTVNAVAVGMLDVALDPSRTTAEVRVEVADGAFPIPQPFVRAYQILGTTVSAPYTWRRTAIYSALELCRGQLAGVLSSVELGDDGVAPSPGTGDAQRRRRSGLYLVAHRIYQLAVDATRVVPEVIGRVAVLDGELYSSVASSNVRTTRRVQRLSATGEQLVTGYARERDERDTRTLAQALSWNTGPRPDEPAQLAGVATAAMGGYPRLYDGLAVAEQDWHELSIAYGVTAVALGSLSAGTYGVATTYRWTDARGQLYESAPDFQDPVTVVANQRLNVRWRPLIQTERQGVRMVLWRTVADGAIYYEDVVTDPAGSTPNQDEQNINLTQSDAYLAVNRVLDQVSGGVRVSVPNEITDWVAESGGRLWAPDPWRGDLVRYTIPLSEGRAPSWTLVQGMTTPTGERATALRELDGRIIAFTANTISYMAGDGPDATGRGGYPPLSRIVTERGATAQEAVIEVPDGLAYGTTASPLLLSRGLGVVHWAESVFAPFEVRGAMVRVMVYNRQRSTVRVATDAAESRAIADVTLRYHTETGRWASDTGIDAIDYAVSQGGTIALVHRDGRVLIQDEGTYTDGGVVYEASMSTPWVHEPARDGLVHGGFTVMGVTLYGDREGPHGLTFELYVNYETTPRYAPAITEATITAREVAGAPYVYRAEWGGVSCHSARVVVRDSAPTTAGWRIAGLDITWDGDGSTAEWQFDPGAIARE